MTYSKQKVNKWTHLFKKEAEGKIISYLPFSLDFFAVLYV